MCRYRMEGGEGKRCVDTGCRGRGSKGKRCVMKDALFAWIV